VKAETLRFAQGDKLRDQGFICPACGAEVPVKAQACPECGSDDKTGWSDDTMYDGTGIEDSDEFDYAEWRRRELRPARPASGWGWWLVAVGLLAVLVWWLIRR
jgi:ribosomal protein L40E